MKSLPSWVSTQGVLVTSLGAPPEGAMEKFSSFLATNSLDSETLL